MRRNVGRMFMGLLLAAGLSACANTYGIPDGGPYFASWEHMKYSLFWEGKKPPLTTEGYKLAEEEGWWGIPVRYSSEELK